MNPTIFIVDDEPEMCNSLQFLMESVKFKTEIYENGASFLKKYKDDCVGCILLDVRMPEMSGMELLDILNERKNRLPVIIMTGYGDIPMAVRAMKSGAVDFILKPFNPQELIEQIQKQIAKCTIKTRTLQGKAVSENFCNLTKREQEVLDLVAQGKLNKEIASKLNITISTVEHHRASLMKKMQARNVAQLLQMKSTLKL